jgi:uncharacterized protein YggE
MKTSKAVTLLAVIASTLPLIAQPNQSISTPEAALVLVEASRIVSLEAEATLRVPADRAVIRLSVSTEAKALAETSEKNQKIRELLKQALVKQGLPENRIRSSRFSSVPQFGTFSGKVKSYRVANQMAITVESEAEFQMVAAQIDLHPEMTLLGLESIDSKEVDNRAAVLTQACEGVNRKKLAAEQALKVKLTPVRLAEASLGSQHPIAQRAYATPSLMGYVPSMSTITGILTDPNFKTTIRALESRSDDGPGFGEKSYQVFIAAEFQIVK